MRRAGLGRRVAVALLAIVGASNAVGSTIELVSPRAGKAVAALGRAALASPAPKVFCKMGATEPFARAHAIEVRYADGATVTYGEDDLRARRLRGPYALRNAFGAALVFAPILPARTTRAVVQRGVCEDAAFEGGLADADVRAHGRARAVAITSAPRAGRAGEPTRVEVACAP